MRNRPDRVDQNDPDVVQETFRGSGRISGSGRQQANGQHREQQMGGRVHRLHRKHFASYL